MKREIIPGSRLMTSAERERYRQRIEKLHAEVKKLHKEVSELKVQAAMGGGVAACAPGSSYGSAFVPTGASAIGPPSGGGTQTFVHVVLPVGQVPTRAIMITR